MTTRRWERYRGLRGGGHEVLLSIVEAERERVIRGQRVEGAREGRGVVSVEQRSLDAGDGVVETGGEIVRRGRAGELTDDERGQAKHRELRDAERQEAYGERQPRRGISIGHGHSLGEST
jgi:hypothetical protein